MNKIDFDVMFPSLINKNKENPEKNYENTTRTYKLALSSHIYEVLYKVMAGVPIIEESNFSLLLKKIISSALESEEITEASNVVKQIIGACPSKVYETLTEENNNNNKEKTLEYLDEIIKKEKIAENN